MSSRGRSTRPHAQFVVTVCFVVVYHWHPISIILCRERNLKKKNGKSLTEFAEKKLRAHIIIYNILYNHYNI